METNSRDEKLIRDLEAAAERIADTPLAELQILLRQAASRLKCLPPPLVGYDPAFDIDKFPR